MMGSSDLPLNNTGKSQAQTVAHFMCSYPLDAIVSSPLLRARETADEIASRYPHIPRSELPELRERSFGVLEGLTYEEANTRYPQITLGTMWQYPEFRPEGGESILDVRVRAEKAADIIVSSHRGKSVAVVTHGAFIRNFVSVLLNIPLEHANEYRFYNTSLSIIEYSDMHGGQAHLLNVVSM